MFKICQWTDECNLLAFVYMLRLMSSSSGQVQLRRGSQNACPSHQPFSNPTRLPRTSADNAKPYMLGTLMVAQKFWDDRALRNHDMPVAWRRALPKAKQLSLRQVNKLEIDILMGMKWQLVRCLVCHIHTGPVLLLASCDSSSAQTTTLRATRSFFL